MATEVEDVDNLYRVVLASSTATLAGPSGGFLGDFLKYIVLVPITRSPAQVTLKDGTNAAIVIHQGGTNSFVDLKPVILTLGAKSTSGAWQITTGTNMQVIAVGKFK